MQCRDRKLWAPKKKIKRLPTLKPYSTKICSYNKKLSILNRNVKAFRPKG